MFDAAFTISILFGIVGCISGLGSVAYQRRQTQLMERAIEAPEGDTDAKESKFTALVNKRVSDTRKILRDEYRPRLAEIERVLRDSHIAEYTDVLGKVFKQLDDAAQDAARIKAIAEEAGRVQNEIGSLQESIQAKSSKNSSDIDALGHEINGLVQQIENMRKGIEVHDSVVKRVRSIAEQLLQITSQPETAGQDGIAGQNEMLRHDEVANQDEAVRHDWMMQRDEMMGHGWVTSEDGMIGQDSAGN